MKYKFKHHWSDWVLRIICVWISSLFLSDSFLYIYNAIFNFKGSIYQPLGYWVIQIYHGHFFLENILSITPSSPQAIFGLSIHLILGFFFSILYVFIIYFRFDFNHRFRDGIIYGLCLILFPLFIELPALGYGLLGIKMPYYFLFIIRTIVFHLLFGIGMALGLNLFTLIRHKKY